MPLPFSCVILVLWLAYAAQGSAPAASNWPGLWGPSRTAVAAGALPSAPRSVEVLWRRPVSGGYSEVILDRGSAFTMALYSGDDFIIALDAATGAERWRARVGPTYRGHDGSDDGPISTPAVEGNDLFALGPHGELIAVDVSTGKERWRHDLAAAFGAKAPVWGFAASPLIEGPLVIIPTGGEKSQGLLAFDRTTGRLAWSAAGSKSTGYSSAVAATIAGARQVIAASPDRVFAVSPATGRLLWEMPGPGGGPELGNSPIVVPGDRVLVSAWEQSLMLRVSPNGDGLSAAALWRSPRLRNAFGPAVQHGGFLYGFVGPQLICMNMDTGDVRWRERTGPGTLIRVGEYLITLGEENGELQVVRATPEAFRGVLKATVLEPGARVVTGPSFADGRFYARNLKEIVAFRLK